MGTLEILVISIGILLISAANVDAFNSEEFENAVKQRLAGIEATLERVLHKNEQLEKRIEALETENINLKQTVKSLLTLEEIAEPKDDEQAEPINVVDLSRQHQGIKEHGHQSKHAKTKRQLGSRSIAFTAVVGIPSITNLVDGQTIIYHKILSNYGGGYNNATGIFTAPVSGVYVFNFAEMIDPGHNEYLNLVKNGQHIILNYGHAIGANHLVSSSRTVAVECELGDEVWVRAAPWSTHGSGQVHGYEFTTFSGWLVAAVDE